MKISQLVHHHHHKARAQSLVCLPGEISVPQKFLKKKVII